MRVPDDVHDHRGRSPFRDAPWLAGTLPFGTKKPPARCARTSIVLDRSRFAPGAATAQQAHRTSVTSLASNKRSAIQTKLGRVPEGRRRVAHRVPAREGKLLPPPARYSL